MSSPNPYEQKLERRRERLERAADRARAESDTAYQRARQMGDVMQGQPVLVGHHSEKRHRRDLAKVQNLSSKACELHSEAKDLDRRAAAVGSGGISSDDPDAVAKLREKLAAMEEKRENFKRLNAWWRKHGTMKGCPGLSDETAARMDTDIPNRYSWERQPIPKWEVSNLGAEIRRVAKRIEELGDRPEARPVRQVGDVTIDEDAAANRLFLRFPGKPAEPVRAVLKRMGFRWSPTAGAWSRMLNNAARAAADVVVSYVGGLQAVRLIPTEDSEGGACPLDPDGQHFVGCGCDA